MKRNLSNKAIKAMAIGMAVAMGSSSLNGVTVFADESTLPMETLQPAEVINDNSDKTSNDEDIIKNEISNENVIEPVKEPNVSTYADIQEDITQKSDNKNIELKIGEDLFNFEVIDPAKNNTVKLVGVTKESSQTNDEVADKAFKVEVENNMLKVTDNNGKITNLSVTEIGNGTSLSNETITIDSTELSSLLTKVTKVNDHAFENVTINGDLTLEKLTHLGKKAFYKANVNGNLTLSGELDELLVKYDRNNDSSKNDHTIKTTGGENSHVFSNLVVTGNLNLTSLKFGEKAKDKVANGDYGKTELSSLGLGFIETIDGSSKNEKGVTVEGKLTLPTSLQLNNYSLRNVEIGELDLYNATIHNNFGIRDNKSDMRPMLPNMFGYSKIDKLTLPKSAVFIAGGAFKGATIKDVDFSKIEKVEWTAFMGATIDGNIKFAPGALINKWMFAQNNGGNKSTATINGDIDLSGASFEVGFEKFNFAEKGNPFKTSSKLKKDGNKPYFQGATINGDLNLSNVKRHTFDLYSRTVKAEVNGILPDILDSDNNIGAFGEMTVNGSVNLTGIKVFPKKVFAGSKIKENIVIDNNAKSAISIQDGAFALNQDKVTIEFKYPISKTSGLGSVYITEKAFESSSYSPKVDIIVPVGSDIAAVKQMELYLNTNANKKINVIVRSDVKTDLGTYSLEKAENGVMLVDFKPEKNTKSFFSNADEEMPLAKATEKDVKVDTFENGVLTTNNQKFNLVQIGNGTTPLSNIDDSALSGHTENVTTIAQNAFKDNKSITRVDFSNVTEVKEGAFAGATNLTTVNLPKVKEVKQGVFDGTTNLTTVDLGSKAEGKVNIPSDIFKDSKNLTNVTTNDASKEVVKNAVEKSPSTNISLSSGGKNETVNNNSTSSTGSSGGSGAVVSSASPKAEENNANMSENSSNMMETKTLSLDMISLPTMSGEAINFTDISANHWAKESIDKLSSMGILNGMDGKFMPNGQTKRADVTIMLVKLLGLQPETNNKFMDVDPNAYYAPYVGTTSTYGIINGYNGMFNPNSSISRQDTMVMISKILESLNLDVNKDTSMLNQFKDMNSISSYAQESVAILVNAGIINGNNGNINPTSPVTRAEMATIMSKLYDMLNK